MKEQELLVCMKIETFRVIKINTKNYEKAIFIFNLNYVIKKKYLFIRKE